MSYDLAKTPRLAAEWETLLSHLADGEWHQISEIFKVTDLAPRTINSLIKRGSATRETQRRAGYIRRLPLVEANPSAADAQGQP